MGDIIGFLPGGLELRTAHSSANGQFISSNGGGSGHKPGSIDHILAEASKNAHETSKSIKTGYGVEHADVAKQHEHAAKVHHAAGTLHKLHGNHETADKHFAIRDKHIAVANLAKKYASQK